MRDPMTRSKALVPGLYTLSVVVTLVITQFALPRGTPVAILYSGLIDGLAAALTAAAIVLVYQASRIINFAQIAIGSVGPQLAFQLIRYERGVPFAASLVVAVALSAAFGVIADILLRRFARAPRLIATVFTLVISTVIATTVTPGLLNLPFLPPAGQRPPQQIFGINSLAPYLPYSGLRYHIGNLPVSFGFGQLTAIELCVVALLLVAAFLRFTRLGAAIRAMASNPERAALLGISVSGITLVVFALAGALGGVSALAEGITGNPAAAYAFTPGALLSALAAAVIARFQNLPRAITAALLISIATDAVGFAYPTESTTIVAAGLLAIVVVGLALQRPGNARVERASVSWKLVSEPRAVPPVVARLAVVRGSRWTLAALVMGGIVLYPVVVNVRLISIGTAMAVFGLVALSLVVLTGWAGQVSFGQGAFVAIGAVVAGGLTVHAGVPFWFSVPMAMIVAALLAIVLGLPALRLPGLYLAAVTFALGVAVPITLFDPKIFGWLLPVSVPRPTLFLLNFDDERSMYFLSFILLAVVLAVVVNLRRSRLGRLLIATRDNESDVRAMGINPTRLKIYAFGISGAIAGLGGAIEAFQLRAVPGQAFSLEASFPLLVFIFFGGVTSVSGALLGAGLYELVQYFLTGSPVLQYISGFATILVIFLVPNGLWAFLSNVRDALLRVIAARAGLDAYEEERDAGVIPLGEPFNSAGLGAIPADQRFRLRSRVLVRSGPS